SGTAGTNVLDERGTDLGAAGDGDSQALVLLGMLTTSPGGFDVTVHCDQPNGTVDAGQMHMIAMKTN
ncbi:MAG: hypothetical protein WBQ41_16080, partial [Solirubrobacterales bacterium]